MIWIIFARKAWPMQQAMRLTLSIAGELTLLTVSCVEQGVIRTGENAIVADPIAVAQTTSNASPADMATAADLQSTLVALYAAANPSVVYIEVPAGSGRGFLYGEEGHIVTNRHVVETGGPNLVIFANDEQRLAEMVGTDPDSDLAVLEVENLQRESLLCPWRMSTLLPWQTIQRTAVRDGQTTALALILEARP